MLRENWFDNLAAGSRSYAGPFFEWEIPSFVKEGKGGF
jgi:hypothetical protein